MPSEEAKKLFEKLERECKHKYKIEHRFIDVDQRVKGTGNEATLKALMQEHDGIPSKSGFSSNMPLSCMTETENTNLDDYVNFVKTTKTSKYITPAVAEHEQLSVNGILAAQQLIILDEQYEYVSFVAQVEPNGNEWLYVSGAVPEGSRVFSCTENQNGEIANVREGFVCAYGDAANNSLNTFFYVDYAKSHIEPLTYSRIETAQQLLLELNKRPTINQAVTRALSLVRCKCTHLPDAVGIEQLAGCCPADQRTFSLQAEVVNNFATLCIACFLQLEQLRTRSWKSYNWSKETTKMIAATTTFFERVDFVDGRFKRRRKRHFDWS